MKIFIDDSGGFEWTVPGVSLFCAVTVSDRTLDGITANFVAWRYRQSTVRHLCSNLFDTLVRDTDALLNGEGMIRWF
jgi:hypothetical protein